MSKLQDIFANEYHEMKEQENTTAMGQGYHTANLVQQDVIDDSLLIEPLQHLALAATTDEQTIAQLVEANAKLTESVTTLTAQLTQTLQTVATFTRNASLRGKAYTQLKFDLQMDPVGYCSSHGYKVKLDHTSATCTSRKAGHQVNATRTNIMGESMANKTWVHPHCSIVPPNNNANVQCTEYEA